MYSFPNLEPVYCSMPHSNCCFLTGIQIYQEAGNMVWSSHLLKNFPQFVVTHTVKGFSVVSEAEVEVFLEFPCFFYDSIDVGDLISGSTAFLNPACTCGSSWFTYCWSLAWRILSITLQSMWNGRRLWHHTPVLLPGKSHGWRSLVGCSPWGC